MKGHPVGINGTYEAANTTSRRWYVLFRRTHVVEMEF